MELIRACDARFLSFLRRNNSASRRFSGVNSKPPRGSQLVVLLRPFIGVYWSFLPLYLP